ncbi:DUF2461 domain-containing protein [Reichenbachiella agariperforans]|uniref:DUF2461 domain-containing protein n=1 Tax=Reichenbachiella agariperforans TaxID=156994 RepID=UPI001C080488|nr:DUF2461 domain-containing protein [Reichenbachiella agariperforans]MBU2916084.1 DUF2461 domain-containing protein [Reichenbachiella agariperforans]
MTEPLLLAPFGFLSQLRQHNDRDWFNAHKDQYLAVHQQVIKLADRVLEGLAIHDDLETPTGKKSLHRIYRDVRFSKDKTPYSTHFGGSFKRASAERRGGYYYHLEPGNTFVIGGFWSPSAADLLQIRKQIQQDPEPLRDILNSNAFQSQFGELLGTQLKTSPRGFDPEDDAIELLRYKQFLIQHKFTDEEAMRTDFDQLIVEQFTHMRPFFDYMSEILTTDLNGESLL